MANCWPNEKLKNLHLGPRKRKEPADAAADQVQHRCKILKYNCPSVSNKTEVKEVMGVSEVVLSTNNEQNVSSGLNIISRQTFVVKEPSFTKGTEQYSAESQTKTTENVSSMEVQQFNHGSSSETEGILELAAGDVCTSDFDESMPWGIELVLETKWIRMKRAAMVEFESKIKKIKQDFKTEKESMEEKYMRDISNLEDQKCMFRELVYQKEKAVTEKNIVISNLSRVLQKQQNLIQIAKAFYFWRTNHLHHRHEQFRLNIIAQKHYERKTKQKILLLWHSLAKHHWRAKVQQFYETRSKQFCQDFARKEEANTEKLRKELTSARQEIQNMTNKMNIQKDLMKRSLLRGVSALNAETIKLFTSTNSDTEGGELREQFTNQQKISLQSVARTTVPILDARSSVPGKKNIQSMPEHNEKVPVRNSLPSGRSKIGVRSTKMTQVSGCVVERHLPYKQQLDQASGSPTKKHSSRTSKEVKRLLECN